MQYQYEYMVQDVYIDDKTDNADCYVKFYKSIIDAMAAYNKQLAFLYENYIYDPMPGDISTRIVTLYEFESASNEKNSYNTKKKIRQAIGRIGDVHDSITE